MDDVLDNIRPLHDSGSIHRYVYLLVSDLCDYSASLMEKKVNLLTFLVLTSHDIFRLYFVVPVAPSYCAFVSGFLSTMN